MLYNFLSDQMGAFMAAKTAAGNFMLSRVPSYESVKDDFPIQISGKEEEILGHDFETFSKMMSFLSGSFNTFILHGFMGSGKSAMINVLPKITDESVLIFRVNCFESTNLDDVLLSLHTAFVSYHNEHRIILPKIESMVFADRINAYIKSCVNPMLFVFDSIEAEKCPLHSDIINFIKHISQMEKVKVIVTSRNLTSNDLPNDSSSSFAIIKLFGKDELIKLLNKHGIQAKDETYEEAFVATKGHYLYISLLMNVISLLNISLASVYNDYSKQNMIIFDFLISKVLTLIPERFLKTLWFLSLIRTGVSEKFLITQKLSTKDELEYLEERMLICREGINIYMKDYVKNTISATISAQTKKDIHNYLHELYESQLPKKPAERDLVISRSTMRRESAYHKETAENTVIEKPSVPTNKKNIDYNYLSYAKGNQNDWNFAESSIAPKQQRFVKPAPRGMETRIRNNMRAKKFDLTNEEISLLNKLNLKVPNAELIRADREVPSQNQKKDFQPYMQAALSDVQNNRANSSRNEIEQNKNQPQEQRETLSDVMNAASIAEQNFEYENALLIYNKAYNMTDSAGYAETKPIIMMQTAYCHKKMQNTDEALRCFEIAYRLYADSNLQKANLALFNMAEIYMKNYNYEQAKSMYEKILLTKQNSEAVFNIRVLLNLSEIENNNSNIEKAFAYYNEALQLAEEIGDKKLICECCFKFGLACDDAGSIDQAFKFYVKCIQTSTDYEVNSYISSAYSNIAGIYEEQNLKDKAAKYYEEAIKIDEAHENWDGLYFAYSKLAAIYQTKSLTIAIDFSFKALNAARNLKDNVYIASSYIQIGDYYYQSNSNEDALKSYLLAKAILIKQPNPENVRKIDVRINDMKARLGTSRFNELAAEFQN